MASGTLKHDGLTTGGDPRAGFITIEGGQPSQTQPRVVEGPGPGAGCCLMVVLIGRRLLGFVVVRLLIGFEQSVVFSIQRHDHDVIRLSFSFAGEDQQSTIGAEAGVLVVVRVPGQVDRCIGTIQSHQKDVGVEIQVVLGISDPFAVG